MHAKYFNSFCCYPLNPQKHTTEMPPTHTQSLCPLNSRGRSQSAALPVSKKPSATSAHRSAICPDSTNASYPLSQHSLSTHTHTTPPPLELPQLNSTLTHAQRGQLQHVVYFSIRTFKRVLIYLQMSMIVITSYLFWSNSAMWYTWKIN